MHDCIEAQKIVELAGYIEDSPYEYNPYLITAPYETLMKRKGTKNAVLLSTGSYDPVHHGHVSMMVQTRALLEKQGYTVMGGVFSTSHDSYVRDQKTPEGVSAIQRGIDITNFLLSHPDNIERWLIHDLWESQIVDHAVNFTTVIYHVRKTLERLLGDNFTLFYLFGEDNSAFALPLVLEEKVIPVVIQRPGYNLLPEVKDLVKEGEALYVPNDSHLSSSDIRKSMKEKPPYVIRCDGKRGTEYLSPLISDYAERIEYFHQGIVNLFSHKSLFLIEVDEQLSRTWNHIQEKYSTLPVLSCDIYYKGDVNLRVSRLFDLSSAQSRSYGITSVDSSLVDSQKEYIYVDDDIATGFTLEKVSHHVKIKEPVSMVNVMTERNIEDVVDERDFLVGAEHGGLMINYNSEYIRFPYMSPYVNLVTRAKIEPEKAREFNRRLWELNSEFYKNTHLTAEDIEAPFLKILGVKETIEEYCLMMARSFA